MAELLGHIAMGLLFALPAWVLWEGRTAGAFVVFVVMTSKLPDLDLTLQNLGLPVKHHGALHTIVFVVGFSVIAGGVALVVIRPVLRRWWRLTENETVRSGTLYLFVTGGFVLGGLSHLFADVLAADPYEPIEPLWPFLHESVAIHAVHYASPWLNLGLLIVATIIHIAVVVSGLFPIDNPFQRWKQTIPAEDREKHVTRP